MMGKDKFTYTKKQKNRLLAIMAIYSVIMLLSIIFILSIPSATIFIKGEEPQVQTVIQTEYIYVQADTETDISADDSVSQDTVYTVREHMGKVCIFTSDGKLFYTVDVYVKTLPDADRRLLEEGFEIIGNAALGEIIQDYGS